MSPEELNARLRAVELLLLDVDGVLTDGRISYVPSGDDFVEVKSFHVADGAGIALFHRAGLQTGIVSGRGSPVVARRAGELGIDLVYLDVADKSRILDEIAGKTALPLDRMAFAGDEVVDLPAMRRVGLPIAVANAPIEVKRHAAYVTGAAGGSGAVREIVELILKAQGKWEGVIADFTG